jgi:hypothetical protein
VDINLARSSHPVGIGTPIKHVIAIVAAQYVVRVVVSGIMSSFSNISQSSSLGSNEINGSPNLELSFGGGSFGHSSRCRKQSRVRWMKLN